MDLFRNLFPDLFNVEQVRNLGETVLKRKTQKQTPRKKMDEKKEMNLYAKMARQAYKFDDGRKENLKGYQYQPLDSSLKRAVYFNPKTNHYIVSQRGTEKTDISDIQDDFAIAHGNLKDSKRHQEELKWLKQFKEGKDITLTGHSLGSNHSKLLALETGLPMVGFSEGSVPTFQNLGENLLSSGGNIKNYKVGYDPISAMNPFSQNIKAKESFKRNPHALDHFIDDEDLSDDELEEVEPEEE